MGQTAKKILAAARGFVKVSPTAQRYLGSIIGVSSGLLGAYKAATYSRQTANWRASTSDGNVSVLNSLESLRARSRQLVRDNPYAAQFVRVMADNLVGTTFAPSANTGDEALNKLVNDVWKKHNNHISADGLPFPAQALLWQAVRSAIESGEVLARRVIRPALGGGFELAVSLLEGDHLDHSYNEERGDGTTVTGGVEIDATGRVVAYHVHPRHPGNGFSIQHPSARLRVPAIDMAHLFQPTRPGQRRGVPALVPGMLRIRDIEDIQEYERIRNKMMSVLSVFVTGTDMPTTTYPGATLTGSVDEDNAFGPSQLLCEASGAPVETLQPGSINYLSPGQDVKIITPQPNQYYREYLTTELHSVAAGWGIPYALLSGDLTQVNYSSIRAGMITFYNAMLVYQRLFLIPLFAQPIWNWVMEVAYLNGEIPVPDVPCTWTTTRYQSVDPYREAAADLENLKAGTRSLREIIAEKGRDPDDVIREMAETKAKLDEIGLSFEWMGAARTAQPEQPAQPDEQPATDEEG